jgi:phosphotransferase family enzyme
MMDRAWRPVHLRGRPAARPRVPSGCRDLGRRPWQYELTYRSMDDLTAWPTSVQDYVVARYGLPKQTEPLRGLSHNRVWRVCFATTCAIVKAAARSDEATFYQSIAPALAAQGVPIPKLEWAGAAPDGFWLVLENIPNPLPRERWHADPAVLAALHCLHLSTVPNPPGAYFCPAWTDTMTRHALTFFPDAIVTIRDSLQTLRMQSQFLFSADCWISGDPNPTNWGIRHNGAVVLYDWERFGRGTPALDLAITIPGLGNDEAFRTVAAGYLGISTAADKAGQLALDDLARAIALAKLWSVIEFLSMCKLQLSSQHVYSLKISRKT